MKANPWNELKLEKALQERLKKEFDKNIADSIWSDYVQIRGKALDIAENINKSEPLLTDHGPKHLADVMNKSYQLVKHDIDELNCAELYFLCIIIMLHDVGNIDGRDNHQNKITEFYNEIRGEDSSFNQERPLVFQAVSAHCGESKFGDKDTLKQLSENTNLIDLHLRLREIAAILRFGDELAEGPQRTCDYILKTASKKNKSLIYHVYAQITTIYVNKELNRIAITYNIDVENKQVKTIGLKKLLNFIYKRILKLDEERRYCKYYTNFLSPYKQTHVTFNVTKKGVPVIDLPEIRLEDKFNIASDNNAMKIFFNQYPQLKIDSIIESIQKATEK